jgi:hypothetical protein
VILTAWKCSPTIRLAGLLHSTYSTSYYDEALFEVRHRSRLRRLIGAESEELVYKFCAIDRGALWESIPARPISVPIEVADRFNSKERLRLTPRDIDRLATIESANIAEQSRSRDGGPSVWMGQVFDLWRRIRGDSPWGRTLPRLSWRKEAAAIVLYRRACWATGAVAVQALDGAIRLNPWAAEPRILRAIRALSTGDTAGRVQGLRGRELLSSWATPWDKRASQEDWLTLAGSVVRTADEDRTHPTLSDFRALVRR